MATATASWSRIYVDKKPGHDDFANQTPMLTEQQVIDQYASPGEGSGAF
jgi:hypothetical protein